MELLGGYSHQVLPNLIEDQAFLGINRFGRGIVIGELQNRSGNNTNFYSRALGTYPVIIIAKSGSGFNAIDMPLGGQFAFGNCTFGNYDATNNMQMTAPGGFTLVNTSLFSNQFAASVGGQSNTSSPYMINNSGSTSLVIVGSPSSPVSAPALNAISALLIPKINLQTSVNGPNSPQHFIASNFICKPPNIVTFSGSLAFGCTAYFEEAPAVISSSGYIPVFSGSVYNIWAAGSGSNRFDGNTAIGGFKPTGSAYLQIRAGNQTGSTARAGGTIIDHYDDVGNTDTSETDLYADIISGSMLNTNGDKLTGTIAGTFVNSATATRQLKLYFGPSGSETSIFDSGAISVSAASDWTINYFIIRDTSSTVKCSVWVNLTGASTNAYDNYARITGLTLSNNQRIRLTGTAAGVGAATNDIIASMGYTEFKPSVN